MTRPRFGHKKNALARLKIKTQAKRVRAAVTPEGHWVCAEGAIEGPVFDGPYHTITQGWGEDYEAAVEDALRRMKGAKP